jgi:hypothetical protein
MLGKGWESGCGTDLTSSGVLEFISIHKRGKTQTDLRPANRVSGALAEDDGSRIVARLLIR